MTRKGERSSLSTRSRWGTSVERPTSSSLFRRPAWQRGRYGWQHPARSLVLAIVAVAVAGTLLLMLPVARAGAGTGGAPWHVALFTATSATSVTGLVVVDTGTYWSPFGHAVLLVLIQIGGLGVMTAASLLGLVVAGRLGLRTRLLAQSETQTVDLGTVRRVVVGSTVMVFAVEAVMVVVLTLRLWLSHGYGLGEALWSGVFHAVSAFNNAGFALWPDSLVRFSSDGVVLGAVSVAVILGGLGYPVLIEALRVRPASRWSVHTYLTLWVSAALTVLGALVVTLGEWRNPATLGSMSTVEKLLSGIFGGITPRSAGFATFDFAQADASTKLSTDLLMLVGGGSGSTAGGIKVTTLAVLVLAVLAEVRGNRDVDVHGRRLSSAIVRQAIAVAAFTFTIVVAATLTLLELTGEPLDTVIFEVASAFSTCGLTTGLSARLPVPEQLILCVLMLVGRVGPITFATALALRQARQAYRNPVARPIVG
jgi:Trk-type K+ transport system membrane component